MIPLNVNNDSSFNYDKDKKSNIERLQSDFELFTYILSHDLKKPLRVLLNNSRELSEISNQIKKDDITLLVKEITESSTEMQQILEILLEYIRLEVFKNDYKIVESGEVIEKSLVNLQDKIKENNAKIEYDKFPNVIGYKKQLIILFENIIDNAIKFRHPNKDLVIKISCKEYSGLVEFIIEDNGIGIEEEYFEIVFLLFQRLHTKEEYPGLGGGLAISKKIVESHGGKICVESNLNVGTTIHFTLCTN